MRLICFSCGKSVTNELPNDTILRAIATCPECLLKDTDDALQQRIEELETEKDKLQWSYDECMNQYNHQQERACNAEAQLKLTKDELNHLSEIIIDQELTIAKLGGV